MDLVDLQRYPIDDLSKPETRALVAAGRTALAADGSFTLPGFIAPPALKHMREEANRLAAGGFHRTGMRNAIPSGRDRKTRVSLSCVRLDQMWESDMRHLFFWDPMTCFVGAVLERGPHHRSADPIASCMVMVLDETRRMLLVVAIATAGYEVRRWRVGGWSRRC